MPANCDACEHRAPDGCYRGLKVFPARCGWFFYARALREQEAEWKREAEAWEADEEAETDA